MKNAVFWDIKTRFLPYRRHIVSATEPSQLMLCKIWGFHGSDYEECRLLGYKNPARTSQETHYVSATESSQLMLCKIWGFHGSDYEQCPSSGMLCHMALVRTDISEEYSASIINVTEISELGTTLAVTSNRSTLRRNKYHCSVPIYLIITVALYEWLAVLLMRLELRVASEVVTALVTHKIRLKPIKTFVSI
jgi:hypothetical protein